MSIKLISLNIEGHKHLEKRVLPFLKQQQADVICLQEVFETDLPLIKKSLAMTDYFLPMSNVTDTSIHMQYALGKIGLAIFTNLTVKESQQNLYYGKTQIIPKFFHLKNPNAMNRGILSCTVIKNNTQYTVATTHFIWSEKGESTSLQLETLKQMFAVLDQFPDIILCGDFNAPRGKETFSNLAKRYQDNIPTEITTTLDGQWHKAGQINYVVDGLFTSDKYLTKNVEIIDNLSDHKAIVAKIDEKN